MPANPSVMLARMVAQVAGCIHFEVGRDKIVLFMAAIQYTPTPRFPSWIGA
jgi:hypothetical protein